MSFVQANLFPDDNQTQAIGLCSVAELNRTQSIGLSFRLGSIEFDWFGNRTPTRVGVRFHSIAELDRTQSTDWVRLSSIFERSIYYAGWSGLLATQANRIQKLVFAGTDLI